MSKTIMIADDNQRVLQVLGRVLEGPQTQIVAVRDGRSVLAAVRERTPDLIILDVMMPGFDGFQVCSALREYPPTRHVPVLMLTGRACDSQRLLGLQAGADKYMTKPFDVNELRAQVDLLLRRGRDGAGDPLASLCAVAEIRDEVERRLRGARPFWFYHAEIRAIDLLIESYGPAFGEELLRQTAALLITEVEKTPGAGFVGRIPGDGFVLLAQERLWVQKIRFGADELLRALVEGEGRPRRWYAAPEASAIRHGEAAIGLEVKEVRCERGLWSSFEAVILAASGARSSARKRIAGLGAAPDASLLSRI